MEKDLIIKLDEFKEFALNELYKLSVNGLVGNFFYDSLKDIIELLSKQCKFDSLLLFIFILKKISSLSDINI